MAILIADKFFEALKDAGIVTEDEYNRTRRVVIDLQVGNAGVMYVERFMDDVVLDVIHNGGLRVVTEPETVTG